MTKSISRCLFALFLFALAQSASAAVSKIVITTPAQAVAPGAVSGQITIQTQDAGGSAQGLPQTGCLLVESSGGSFSSSATNWNPISVLSMNKGTSNRSFYFKSDAAGTYAITVKLALKPEDEGRSCSAWPASEWGTSWNAAQNIAVGTAAAQAEEQPQAQPQTQTTQAQSIAGSQTTSGNPVPGLDVLISADPVAVAGGGSFMTGSATGIQGGTIPNARYSWNFGDGGTADGQTVFHAYSYPGKYVAVLTASSGQSMGTARVMLEVVEPDIALRTENDDSLTVINNSTYDLNIGGWSLARGGRSFAIPQDTMLLAGGGIRFAPALLKLPPGDAQLLYPNGMQAARGRIDAHSDGITYLKPGEISGQAVVHLANQALSEKNSADEPAPPPEVSADSLVAGVEESGMSLPLWASLAGLLALVVLAVAGVMYGRLQHASVPGSSASETSLSADEYEIIDVSEMEKKDEAK